MYFDQDVHIRADCITHCSHSLDCGLLLVTIDKGPPWTWKRVEFQRCKALGNYGPGAFGQLFRGLRVAPTVGIHAQPPTDSPAQQVVHWLIGGLAYDVP